MEQEEAENMIPVVSQAPGDFMIYEHLCSIASPDSCITLIICSHWKSWSDKFIIGPNVCWSVTTFLLFCVCSLRSVNLP